VRSFARLGRKVAVGVVGSLVVAVGVVMIVLPGPASLIIPAGLAILATEFSWARRLREHLRVRLVALGQRLGNALPVPRHDGGRSDTHPHRVRP
jgi:uncharacterized protein (TIGR02611 family)